MYQVNVDNLLIELTNSIELLNKIKSTVKDQHPEFDDIKAIQKRYTLDELFSFNVVKNMNPDEIVRIYELLGLRRTIDEIKSGLKDDEYVYSIVEQFNNYLLDYKEVTELQNNTADLKIKKYQGTIDAILDINNPVNVEEVLGVMNAISFQADEKWKVMINLEERNKQLKLDNESKIIFNTKARISRLESVYFVDAFKYEINVILKEIHDQELNINLINTYAINIANKYNLDIDLVTNILITLIASDKIKDKNNISDVDRVLDNEVEVEDIVILKAKNIIKRSKKLYEGDMSYKLKDYQDYLPIDMMEHMDISYVEAIDLKLLPLVKSLGESLDTLNKLSKYDTTYQETYDLICDLVDLIDSLNIKKENEVVLNSIEDKEEAKGLAA